MSGDPQNLDTLLELAQQESIQRLSYAFELGRRDFLKLSGGGMLVCLCVSSGQAQESGRPRRPEDLPQELQAWLHIGEDGGVTVFTGKVEMGQNIRTSLTQQVAEELRTPMSAITLVMGNTDRTPFDMGTFGSRTTPTMGPQLRKVAASARELLLDRAAQHWNVDRSTLVAGAGKVLNAKSGLSLSYGELVKESPLVKIISDDVPLAAPKDWSVAGTSAPKINGHDFVTGRHKYTSDLSLAGMLHGKVLRPTAFRAKLVSLDATAAEKIAGAKVVRDGDFVGVVAPDEFTALRALRALKAKWDGPSQLSEAELFDYLRKHPNPEAQAEGRRGGMNHATGSLEAGYKAAAKTLQQTYTVAYIAHTPLEPRAAVAEWKGSQVTVWTGTQRPFAVSEELAQAFRISSKDARVIVPDTGSAYGGKHTGDAAVEAARLAKAAGKPVKLVWTREEEFTWAYFRPAGVIDVKAAVNTDGTIAAWEFDNYNSGPAAIGTPYSIANQRIDFHPADSPLRQGSYRGLAATANHFARESFMDELAHAISLDPLAFRMKNLTDPRLRAVFEAAAEKFGWSKQQSSPTHGFGIAGGVEKGGYVATCAEVQIDSSGSVHIARVLEAWESGAVVNPQGLRNQIEGAIVQGIGGALFEAIHFNNRRILNAHLADYRVPRFRDTPQIEVLILDRKDLPPAGAGETPLVALAPAVGNAIFAATGKRVRSLPMVPEGLQAKA
jgi:CO/xanthine dehydrogenase Mo-binding subunit